LMKMSANSSRSFCVTRPEGMTRQRRPSMVIVRMGISGQLHFAVDAGGIEGGIGSSGVSARQRIRVRCFDELERRAWEICFLEYPEMTLRARVMLLLPLHSLEESLPLARRDERSLHAQGSRHRCSDHSSIGEI